MRERLRSRRGKVGAMLENHVPLWMVITGWGFGLIIGLVLAPKEMRTPQWFLASAIVGAFFVGIAFHASWYDLNADTMPHAVAADR